MPTGRYTDVIERLQARRGGSRRNRRSRRPRARPPCRHHSFHRRPAARPRRRRRRAALRGAARCRTRAASSSARARRCARSRMRCARSTGSATATLEQALADGRGSFRQGALDPPAAAGLAARRATAAYEVELVDGEDGVSPGQACVFYDAAEGQARVLGGGFIPARSLRPTRAARTGCSA